MFTNEKEKEKLCILLDNTLINWPQDIILMLLQYLPKVQLLFACGGKNRQQMNCLDIYQTLPQFQVTNNWNEMPVSLSARHSGKNVIFINYELI